MPIRIAFCTNIGSTPGQQDSILIGTQVYQDDDLDTHADCDGNEVLLAIADGLAVSAQSGHVSRALLEVFAKAVPNNPQWLHDGVLSNRHLREAHLKLCDRAALKPRLRGGACTIVAAHIHENKLAIINCGDSRAYIRQASGDIRQLSRDHTELQRMIESGEADEDTQYASLYDQLTDWIEADSNESEFAIHRDEMRLATGDLLVLCSDGVHDVLPESQWHDIMRTSHDPATLVAITRSSVLETGAFDNFSVIAAAITAAE